MRFLVVVVVVVLLVVVVVLTMAVITMKATTMNIMLSEGRVDIRRHRLMVVVTVLVMAR